MYGVLITTQNYWNRELRLLVVTRPERWIMDRGRMFVMWEQLRTPDNKRIDMVNTAAAGPRGEAGIDGWIDSLTSGSDFGGSLMLSMVQDVAAAAADNAPGKKIVIWIIPKTHDRQWLKWLKSHFENSINILQQCIKPGWHNHYYGQEDIDFFWYPLWVKGKIVWMALFLSALAINRSIFYKNQSIPVFSWYWRRANRNCCQPSWGEIWTEINGDWTFHNNDN